jgi:hypothetical protein
MLRNKPLKFYAHNGSKYDNNLFLPTFLNDSQVVSNDFLNKTESRFTEVKLSFKRDKGDVTMENHRQVGKYKLSFNDSMMLLPGPLAKLCSAWVNPSRDSEILEKLMKIFYKEQRTSKPLSNNHLVNKSFHTKL